MALSALLLRGVGAGLVALVGAGGWSAPADEFGALDSLAWKVAFPVAGGVIGALLVPYVMLWPLRGLARIPVTTLLVAIAGLLTGLVMGALLSMPVSQLPGWGGTVTPAALTVALAVFGMAVLVQREQEILHLFFESRQNVSRRPQVQEHQILLDTSAIIDGRIADVGQAGFIQGTFVVPRFILDELRHIADSSDSMRRNRGRRGLEMLNKLRKESTVPLRVLDVEMRNGSEVDGKLVQLAKNLRASIVTTDYNLNRVAELQGVQALNVNELANTLKPVVLPGEEMMVHVIQDGKEAGQGVGFLDDGTMVVVEGGKRYINTHLDVLITRVLQTSAGRIIFAQPKP